ncbi:probable LRR receptor-like serine/threonine-protein kinase At5g65240 isoform X2 [Cornus florida]|uniref:probable LRR receptor-like serine/threonine-protein kinase At5g65240 isoform X2 n=1 Tax=Cornus florida TaxID=4283 RepID=UPI0028A193EA|nr:probable LRR receptor-like serine/threonine-protein kinase At5g65240 isoform X2 [Cornus florida]XP_059626473.1 probable LRR receptor-like serine/threonine-protein kinase At5g65240 isoform X2 [Cornus florida]XP_059626474.1 probable LRR receptor-like serine/threonine-protein kinase At5g65240 isoform X2 [Cornus florida]XP_059626475.1 probable LRR receptor-like serine/threonine-protein kinase At5g65240 isoform X2 [Cornus florida]
MEMFYMTAHMLCGEERCKTEDLENFKKFIFRHIGLNNHPSRPHDRNPFCNYKTSKHSNYAYKSEFWTRGPIVQAEEFEDLDVDTHMQPVNTDPPKPESVPEAELVNSFLQSLGFEKHSVFFKDEKVFEFTYPKKEIDKATLKHMTDEDLKALGLRMNNAISGPIPAAIGKLEKLQTLDISSNKFNGAIPSSLGNIKNLKYLRLNNNNLTGPVPQSLSKVEGLNLVDLSFNNLSGSLPKISARAFKIIGNTLNCGQNSGSNCSVVYSEPLSFSPDGVRAGSESGTKTHNVATAFGTSFSAAFVIIMLIGSLIWWRYRHHQQIFFDVTGKKFLLIG